MTRVMLSLILLAGVVFLLGLQWALPNDPSRPHWRVPTNMDDGAPYDAFAPNPNTPDGKTLQPLAEGTIARGTMPLHYAANPDDARRAGEELVSPLVGDDAAALQRGAVVYARFCGMCHGEGGAGDGLVARRGFPPPPSLLAENAMTMPDGQMYHILTYGQGNMPAYAPQMTVEDRWKAILHVRTLQQAAQPADAPAELAPADAAVEPVPTGESEPATEASPPSL